MLKQIEAMMIAVMSIPTRNFMSDVDNSEQGTENGDSNNSGVGRGRDVPIGGFMRDSHNAGINPLNPTPLSVVGREKKMTMQAVPTKENSELADDGDETLISNSFQGLDVESINKFADNNDDDIQKIGQQRVDSEETGLAGRSVVGRDDVIQRKDSEVDFGSVDRSSNGYARNVSGDWRDNKQHSGGQLARGAPPYVPPRPQLPPTPLQEARRGRGRGRSGTPNNFGTRSRMGNYQRNQGIGTTRVRRTRTEEIVEMAGWVDAKLKPSGYSSFTTPATMATTPTSTTQAVGTKLAGTVCTAICYNCGKMHGHLLQLREDKTYEFTNTDGLVAVRLSSEISQCYGREYRERLLGKWGVVDVNDCCSCARFLVEKRKVDAERLCISGSSAGGYTTLASLAFRQIFKAGASLYGVADLSYLQAETPKFESHYITNLVGNKNDFFVRSPINFVDNFSCPVILFQGLEDKVLLHRCCLIFCFLIDLQSDIRDISGLNPPGTVGVYLDTEREGECWSICVLQQAKFGIGESGWLPNKSTMSYGVGLWRSIFNTWDTYKEGNDINIRNGQRISFWHDVWCDSRLLALRPFRRKIGKVLWDLTPYAIGWVLCNERNDRHFKEKKKIVEAIILDIVTPEQSRKIYKALKQKGLPVALVEYEGEQHGFRKAENIKFTLEQQMVFFARLVGKFEVADEISPIGIDNFD
ncbi:hypothetical protein GIB67_003146 [Kingdonia uniflora]|uniref:Peptidase S9 prolyl oligopeptidase catalytic domain-containing protein n=1 Tax=Kingdonia uniflora TaxID=39325 RepID=A0A7J7N6E2_9MAGN|nr:hypothetical protein GIB67_003146 [Kingdonia uniflora]